MNYCRFKSRIKFISLIVALCIVAALFSSCQTTSISDLPRPTKAEKEIMLHVRALSDQDFDDFECIKVHVLEDEVDPTAVYTVDISNCPTYAIEYDMVIIIPTEPFDPAESSFVAEKIYELVL